MRILVLGILLIFTLGACQQQEQPPVRSGKVHASAAYLQHFGEPPIPQQGYAYAQVGYLPRNDASGRVRPLPLFLFSESQHLDRILSQLFSDKMLVSGHSRLLLPFAQGVRLEQLAQAGDTLVVSLADAGSGAAVDRAGIDRAITETACQFEDVSRVRILYNGEPSPQQPLEGYHAEPELIDAVGPPMLLNVVGTWEEGAEHPQEILINFDRPMVINNFRLLDRAGEPVGGKYFTSVFDMAVVVRPDKPELIKAGMLLTVDWDISDQLGRSSSSVASLALQRQSH